MRPAGTSAAHPLEHHGETGLKALLWPSSGPIRLLMMSIRRQRRAKAQVSNRTRRGGRVGRRRMAAWQALGAAIVLDQGLPRLHLVPGAVRPSAKAAGEARA